MKPPAFPPRGALAGRARITGACLLGAVAALVLCSPRARADSVEEIRAALSPAKEPGYQLFALRVGISQRASRRLFILDRRLGERIEVAFAFWLIRGNGRVVLVDSGFVDRPETKAWKIEGYRDPVASLAKLGIQPSEVTDLVITHNHWDHIGGLASFPAATVWINRVEADGIRAGKNRALRKLLERVEGEGRLRLLDGRHEVAPSLLVVPVGLHTPGFQYLVLRNPDGLWVVASDIAPLRANFERRSATGQASDSKRARQVLDEMLRLVDNDLSRIVPGHEPALFREEDIVQLAGNEEKR